METSYIRQAFLILAGLLIASYCRLLPADEVSQWDDIDPAYYETDVRKLIEIDSGRDVADKRKALIQYLWAEKGFPCSKLPATVNHDVPDDRYARLFHANLKQIDKITVSMDYGLNSTVYHFISRDGNNRLIIYHQGHRGDFISGIDTIAAFLDSGYSVMGFSMPLLGMNNQPVVYLKRFGRLKLTSHNHLKFLDSPIRYFAEPVIVALNYARKFEYESVNMVGISGGGWTTVLIAAIDPRIKRSYPVAGSFPIYLRASRDWGDYEQTVPSLYRIANYPELYVMGAYGSGRKQFQILNKYDSCCFGGVKYQTYEDAVTQAVMELGEGEFEILLDDTHKEHKISNYALTVILNDLD